jgi:hypothetical protein
MKTKSLLLAVVLIVIFMLGIMVGLFMKNSLENIRPINLNPFSRTCLYNGKSYKEGEGFRSIDGCNGCSCMNGHVACTLMACE